MDLDQQLPQDSYLLVDSLLIEVISRPRYSMFRKQVIQFPLGIDFLDGDVVCRSENGSTLKGKFR